MGEPKCFETVVVLPVDDDVTRPVPSPSDRPNGLQARVDRLPELRNNNQTFYTDLRLDSLVINDGGSTRPDAFNYQRFIGVVRTIHDPAAAPNRMRRQTYPLGKMALEYPPEAPSGAQQIYLPSKIRP